MCNDKPGTSWEDDDEDLLANRFADILNIVEEIEHQKGESSRPPPSSFQYNPPEPLQNGSSSKPAIENDANWQKVDFVQPSTSTRPSKPTSFNPFGYGKLQKARNEIHPVAPQLSISSTSIQPPPPGLKIIKKGAAYSPPTPSKHESNAALSSWPNFQEKPDRILDYEDLYVRKQKSNRKMPLTKICIPPNPSKKPLPGGMVPYIPLYPYFEVPYEFKRLGNSARAIKAKEVLKQTLFRPEFESIRRELEKSPSCMEELAKKLEVFTYFSLINEDLQTDDPIDTDCQIIFGPKMPKEKSRLVEIHLSEKFKGDDRLKKNMTVTLSNDFSYTQATILNIGYKHLVVSIFEDNELDRFLDEEECDIYANVNTFVYGNVIRAIGLFLELQVDFLAYPRPEFSEPHDQFLHRQQYEIMTSPYFSGIPHLNQGQIEAIRTIAKNEHEKWPFILFGPPGTGKTTTLIEAVRLLTDEYFNINNRILICTPSNAAADKITRDILKREFLDKSKVLRLMSRSADVRNYADEIQQVMCIAYNDFGIECFGIPENSILADQYKVIICTLASSSYIYCSGLPRGHFSHIFIDEAGQATEAESWLPLATLVGPQTRVVLSGDPMQLGPVVLSRTLKEFGADESMLKRLSEVEVYKNDRRLMKMLTENYRSHELIIEIPSKLYYGGSLIAALPIEKRNELCGWSELPNKSIPIIFHNVSSGSEVKKDTSWSNPQEAFLVCSYVQKLRHHINLYDEDIGIISPYNGQSDLLRKNPFLKDCPELTIGSVESFQGAERKVIIITTSRTSDTGFLDCNRRFNTAITRAMNLLIVVGHAQTLRRIPCWREFIDFCISIGAYVNE